MFRSIESYLVIAVAWAFLQQMFQSGFTSASSSTIQKLFGLSVWDATMLSTTYNVSKLLSSAILSYVTMRGNVPRQQAWQVLFSGIGCILYGLPGMLVTLETDSNDFFPICSTGDNSTAGDEGYVEDCSNVESETHYGYWIIIFSQVINGVSGACLHQVVPGYINKHASPSRASRYIGIFYASSPAGLAVGFLMIGGFIKAGIYYVPFLACGFLQCCLTFCFLMLPAEPTHIRAATISVEEQTGIQERKTELEKDASNAGGSQSIRDGFIDFLRISKSICLNKVWLLCCLGSVAENFTTQVYIVNGPQLMEAVYNVHKSFASVLCGLVVVPGAIIGTLIGGVIGERHKNLSESARFNMTCAVASGALLASIYFSKCPRVEFEGLEANTDTVHNTECGCTNCGKEVRLELSRRMHW